MFLTILSLVFAVVLISNIFQITNNSEVQVKITKVLLILIKNHDDNDSPFFNYIFLY